jgi:uncharacterized protein YjbI with pentapeptide repeats
VDDTNGPGRFRGAIFVYADMSDAGLREVNFADARMRGVLLFHADIDGAVDGSAGPRHA